MLKQQYKWQFIKALFTKVKGFLLIALLLLNIALTACQSTMQAKFSEVQTKELKIFATAFPAYDLAYSLLFTRVESDGNLKTKRLPNLPFACQLELLTKAGTDPHNFEPSVHTGLSLEKADLILQVGLDIDQQYDALLANLSQETKEKVKIFKLKDQVDLLDIAQTAPLVNQDEQMSKDAHVWLSPRRQIKLLTALSQNLIALVKQKYPEDIAVFKSFIEKQLSKLCQLWQDLDKAYLNVFKTATLKKLIFADRFPLRYLCHDYQLGYKAAFNSCSHQLDPDLQTLTSLHELVKAEDCRVIFYTEFGQAKLAKVISGQANELTANMAEKIIAKLKRAPQTDYKPIPHKEPKRYIALFRTGHTISQSELEQGYTIYALQRDNLALLDLATHQAYNLDLEEIK